LTQIASVGICPYADREVMVARYSWPWSSYTIHVAVFIEITLTLEATCFVRTHACCRTQGICVQRTLFFRIWCHRNHSTGMCMKIWISSLDWPSTDIQRIWVSPLNCSVTSFPNMAVRLDSVASNCKTIELTDAADQPAKWVFTSEDARPSPGADLSRTSTKCRSKMKGRYSILASTQENLAWK
jgi:hypothetical protein